MRSECINAVSAAMGRQITKKESEKITEKILNAQHYLARKDQRAFLSMSRSQRLEEAAKLAANMMQADALLKQKRAALTVLAHDRFSEYFGNQSGLMIDSIDRTLAPKRDDQDNFQSVETKSKAINNQYTRMLSDDIESFGAKMLGVIENNEAMIPVYKELRGEDTGIADAKNFAKKLASILEALRIRFNDSGGKIGKLEDYGNPQSHSQHLVWKAGKDAWVAFIEPLLDRSRYVRPDGISMSSDERKAFLGEAWTAIAYDGRMSIEPGMITAQQMMANRNAARRQLHFKNAESYIKYHQRFADKSLMATIMGHIDQMSREIAALEIYGPNPELQYKLWKEKAAKEAGDAGMSLDKIVRKLNAADHLYDAVMGSKTPIANQSVMKGFTTIRNLMAMRLGSAIFSSFGDEGSAVITAAVNNMSGAKYLQEQFKAIKDADARRQARRMGLGLETMLFSINRFSQENISNSLSQKISGAVIRSSGLSFLTEARRQGFGVMMMDGIKTLVESHATLDDLDKMDNRILLSKGVTPTDWAIWRLAQPEKYGDDEILTADAILNINPAALAASGFTTKEKQDAADRLMGAILEETGMAIIEPGARERATTQGGIQRGTWSGELWLSILQFKSFPIAMVMRHGTRMRNMDGKYGSGAYAAALIALTTIGGALGLQLNEIANGRDPLDMTDGRFLFRSFLKGGSLGIYGDFLQSQTTQHGQGSLASLLGPTAGLTEGFINLSQGNLVQMALDEDTHFGAEAVSFVKGLTPGTSVWYTKAAFDHLLFQKLQEAASPGYSARMEQRAKREFGQKYWWRPSHSVPDRLPDLLRVAGG